MCVSLVWGSFRRQGGVEHFSTPRHDEQRARACFVTPQWVRSCSTTLYHLMPPLVRAALIDTYVAVHAQQHYVRAPLRPRTAAYVYHRTNLWRASPQVPNASAQCHGLGEGEQQALLPRMCCASGKLYSAIQRTAGTLEKLNFSQKLLPLFIFW